jgi:hypothetical protein
MQAHNPGITKWSRQNDPASLSEREFNQISESFTLLDSSHSETREFPSSSGRGRIRVGVITIGISRLFISIPPHPTLLPRGEREFPDEN